VSRDPNEVAARRLAQGYIEVQEFKHLTIGARVRLWSEQWPDADRLGTGNIERIFHSPNSAWERTYGRPDVELIVKRDRPGLAPDETHAFVADYHVKLVEDSL